MSGLAQRFLPGICRVYGWAGTAPRHWGSSWQPGTQKAPKAQPLRRLSGHGLRWGHCSFAQCFCAGSVSGALACWCCFLRCAGDFSASAQPPWQRLSLRRDTAVSDVATLLWCLWLAGWSAQLAAPLFCAAQGRATRETPGTVRRLLSHFAAAMVLSAAVSAVGGVLVLAVGGGR